MEIDEAQIESLARALVGAASPGAHKTLDQRWEMMFGPTKELYRKRARWLIEDGWTHHDYVGSK